MPRRPERAAGFCRAVSPCRRDERLEHGMTYSSARSAAAPSAASSPRGNGQLCSGASREKGISSHLRDPPPRSTAVLRRGRPQRPGPDRARSSRTAAAKPTCRERSSPGLSLFPSAQRGSGAQRYSRRRSDRADAIRIPEEWREARDSRTPSPWPTDVADRGFEELLSCSRGERCPI